MHIRIEGLHKRFGSVSALGGIDLDIASGQLLAVLGPSGSGKTTLLRTLAGLDGPDGGRILFDDRDATALAARARRVGLVFQHYALFPHLSVFDNVAFGLRARPRRERPTPAELHRRVDALLAQMQIGALRDRLPDQLSGGERQRVALARALAIEPSVLLLDEPFGALDAKVRSELRRWLRTIHEHTGYTTVLVTHDQDEALELADRVVLLRAGRIEQEGTPETVYAEPASAFAFDFLGRSGHLSGQVRGGAFHPDGSAFALAADGIGDGPARLFVRPHDLALTAPGEGLDTVVRSVRAAGGRHVLRLDLPQQARALELDLAAATGTSCPAAGARASVRPLRYRVYAGDDRLD